MGVSFEVDSDIVHGVCKEDKTVLCEDSENNPYQCPVAAFTEPRENPPALALLATLPSPPMTSRAC
jgi:hypothetical protein